MQHGDHEVHGLRVSVATHARPAAAPTVDPMKEACTTCSADCYRPRLGGVHESRSSRLLPLTHSLWRPIFRRVTSLLPSSLPCSLLAHPQFPILRLFSCSSSLPRPSHLVGDPRPLSSCGCYVFDKIGRRAVLAFPLIYSHLRSDHAAICGDAGHPSS